MKHPEMAELYKVALRIAGRNDPTIRGMDDLAERLGVNRSTVFRWRRGAIAPDGLAGTVLREIADGWLPKDRR